MTHTEFRNAYLDGLHTGALASIARRAASDHDDSTTAAQVDTLRDGLLTASLDTYSDAEFAIYALGYAKGFRNFDKPMSLAEIAGTLAATLVSLQSNLETQLATAA
jgi:hypothetical protein